MDQRFVPSGLRLVRTITGSPRLRSLLTGLGYTERDQRLAWRLVARAGRGGARESLLLHAFLEAWSTTAHELVERESRVKRARPRGISSR